MIGKHQYGVNLVRPDIIDIGYPPSPAGAALLLCRSQFGNPCRVGASSFRHRQKTIAHRLLLVTRGFREFRCLLEKLMLEVRHWQCEPVVWLEA
jgi:hypothetical protein